MAGVILHLVRHSRPVGAEGICYGRLDLPAEGVDAAAARLAALLPPDLPVWTSPLRRCRDLAERLHPAPRVDLRLREMDFGAWEGCSWDDIGAAALDAWATDLEGFVPPGGESARAVQARALDFVAGLAVPEAVVVTHAGVMRMLVAHWEGVSPAEWPGITFGYGSVTTVAVDGERGAIRHWNG